ncbi:type I-E CRISPR-associated endonuclease Cas1e [Rothia sp. P13129]|uniref:type I-E CRISPR-associated endonuclease Cas1e n=1 Tax=unclassified Rothia (in: high G+C Gram-positive bacteria) TaxID=2689056 RepID=UPI003ABF08B5
MAYSDEALAFSTIPASHQVRLEDRVSFLYLEYCVIKQEKTGVVAWGSERGSEKLAGQKIQLPVSSLAVLMLGPGTSISQPAITSCTRAGVTVLFSGGGGVPAYSHATPLTSSARWAIAQARTAAQEKFQKQAALILYKKQLGIEKMPGGSIATMRGLEGRTIRNLYREQAKKHGVQGFKRDVSATDNVNVALNLAHSILYGCAASACAALGLNPALGVIHRGDIRSLLYDLADLYKPSLSIPLAFSFSSSENIAEDIRRAVRRELVRQNVLQGMVKTLIEVYSPQLPHRDDDRLISDRGEEVTGHTQYGRRAQ